MLVAPVAPVMSGLALTGLGSGASSLPGPDAVSTPPTSPVCSFCAGAGWKYVVQRVALRVMAQAARPGRALARRSCLDCGGSGRLAAS